MIEKRFRVQGSGFRVKFLNPCSGILYPEAVPQKCIKTTNISVRIKLNLRVFEFIYLVQKMFFLEGSLRVHRITNPAKILVEH
jgi:hypothetical protein